MAAPRHPTLYQINTRVWLHELGLTLRRTGTSAAPGALAGAYGLQPPPAPRAGAG